MIRLLYKKTMAGVAGLLALTAASAQTNTPVVTGTFTEKVNAELWVTRTANGKLQRVAIYNINPDNQDFAFAIPRDSVADYRFQVNLKKPAGGRHMKVDKICVLPLTLDTNNNYTLKIVPSKLDTAKKRGWELKKDATKPSAAVISGKIVNWKMGLSLSLQKVVNGETTEGNSVETTGDNQFGIACPVRQEGFYYLSSPRWRLRVYLKPSDKLELHIDGKTGMPQLVNGSLENQSLFQWQQLIAPITRYGYNETMVQVDGLDLNAYISEYENLQPAITQFMAARHASNARFNKGFQQAMETDRDLAPLNLLYQYSVANMKGYRPRPSNFKEVPAYFQRFIQPRKFGNTALLLLGEAMYYMDLYTKLVIASMPEPQRKNLSPAEKLGLMMNAISSDTLKSYFLYHQLDAIGVNNLSEFRETFEPFKKYANLPVVNKKYKEVYGLFSDDTAFIGKSSYNFSLPDTSGRVVSMKDFRGKVILIDVWATWCGPCKAQIPFLKEIEEEYKDNKDIVFMGISVDLAKDRQKWVDFIKKENLAGVQLIDAGWNAFAKKYRISAIPRFMLIDKKGNWIEIRCPRPEAKEELKKYLDRALQQ